MKNFTASAAAQAAGGILCGSQEGIHTEITAVITDSRKIQSGCLFAAIRGDNSDGHAYIDQAVKAGAGAVLGEEIPEGLPVPGIRVDNTRMALQKLAAWYLDQIHIPAVGIIGSAGKTSTKEMTALVLEQKYRVLKTEGNFNNELGVPLTIFRLTEGDEIAVIEMGINHFGEMDRLGKIVRPDTAVMTNIGTAHLEFLGSREGILKAKSEVFRHMKPDGCVILNGDDDMLSTIHTVNGKEPVRYGIENPDVQIRAESVEALGLEGMQFELCTGEESKTVTMPSPGIHSVYNALAGAAVGIRYGLTLDEIAEGIRKYKGLPGRQHIVKGKSITVIDDCYNANPSSMKSSLSILQNFKGRRIAILGDMGELGEQAEELHREVGQYAASLNIDRLYCIGKLGKQIGEAYASATGDSQQKVICFDNKETLLDSLHELIKPEDIILVKASHFMGFDSVVRELEKF